MTEVACPQCTKPVEKHCGNCAWLRCTQCCVVFGKDNYILYGRAKTDAEHTEKRKNGMA